MPGCAVHLQLACRVLDAMRSRSLRDPFDPHDLSQTRAFLHGSNAPDMGYYPGGFPLLTDYSHYIKSNELVRNLIHRSPDGIARAFAYGWLTHVLGDAEIHPIVNRAVSEHLGKGTEVATPYADDPAAHVRVEMGLDAWLYESEDFHVHIDSQPIFDRQTIGVVSDAYRDSYSVEFDPDLILRSHRALAKFVPWLLTLDRVSGRRFLRRPLSIADSIFEISVAWPIRKLSSWVDPRGTPCALTHTICPSSWFVTAVNDVKSRFAETFLECVSTQLKHLQPYNLDTGDTRGMDDDYPLAKKTLDHWLGCRAKQAE